MHSNFWRIAAILLIAALFYVGTGLRSNSPDVLPTFTTPVYANVGIGADDTETIITCSEDGQTVYMWRYFGNKPPKFLGKSDAILDR